MCLLPAFLRAGRLYRWLILAFSLLLPLAGARAEILVSSNTLWRYLPGTAEASLPVTNSWTTNGFSDATWLQAPAPFYYGSNYNITGGTRLDSMQSNYSCIYLRTTFVLTNAGMIIGISNRVFPDDGFVLYLNGIEIRRFNVPGTLNAPVSFTNQATSTNFSAIFFQNNALTNALRTGTNTLAIQAFNVHKDDRDFHINPELHLAVADVVPPALLFVAPAAGTSVTNLTQLAVTFSETVTNVQAGDLRINGLPATSLTGSNASYTFGFQLPTAGALNVTWNLAGNIRDLGGNRFNPTNVTHTFTHFVEAPKVISATPPFGATVSALNQVTVIFNRPVTGVSTEDFLINGQPASTVSGSNTSYTFTFPQPESSAVTVSWDINQVITDVSGIRMIESENSWSYSIVDTLPPTVALLTPTAGATVGSLGQVEVIFNEPVLGLDAGDLLVNGGPAASVFGSGTGPYLFQFPQPADGTVSLAWNAGHDIRDRAGLPFGGGTWNVTLSPALFQGDVIINEFAAANLVANAPLDTDEFAQLEDWIELRNRGTNVVRLQGWSLTDDQGQPGKWVLPDVSLTNGQYLVIYASGRDRRILGGTNRLHTNFKLNPFGGYLGLFNAEFPRRAVSEFAPEFPEQRNDYSYGLNSSNEWRYFASPTPGTANGASALTLVAPKPSLNVARGYFDKPFTLVATTELPGATLRYTTDGSEPTASSGFAYNGPFTISNSTVLRIAAFASNALPSRANSQSYLFLHSIFTQSASPGTNFPNTFGTQSSTVLPADYEMDPEILTNAAYANLITNALLSLPVVSLMIKPADMWDATSGIYTHPLSRGAQWEKPCSMEFFSPDRSEADFQVDAGLQIQGNASREPLKQPKHPLKVQFKGDYGPANLRHKLFHDSPRDEFDSVNIRVDFNFSWLHWDGNQRLRGQRTRDAWMKDSMRALGGLASHNRYAHLFINGLYWGVCDPSERPDASFASAYLGGEKENYDAINEAHAAVDGTNTTLLQMIALPNATTTAQYDAVKQYLEITQFIDYMLLHFFVGHEDWGYNKNFYAVHPRTPSGRWHYIPWDGENILGTDVNRNDTTRPTGSASTGVPSGLHTKLATNTQYRLDFADRVHRHFFNDGVLMPSNNIARWMNRARQVELPIILESARWGDYRRDAHVYQTAPYELYTRDNQWRTEQNRLVGTYFPQRTAIVLAQLRAQGLYPNNTAPSFSQHGGLVPAGFTLAISATNTIYYTTNGSDPRMYGTGAVSPLARAYTGPFSLGESMVVKARMLSGTNWSALNEAAFVVNSLAPSLAITEIMYNPVGGDAYEFLELQNLGTSPLNLGQHYFDGIGFTFPFGFSLNPGQRLVLGNNANTNAFLGRYPGVTVAGWFSGSLNNGGEKLSLLDSFGRVVLAVSYDDERGWPLGADGQGASLELIDQAGSFHSPANWRSSAGPNGTPGTASSPAPATPVILNEILAENVASLDHEGTRPDWVELHNTTSNAVDLSGWGLSDDGNPQKFILPVGTTIAADGYLVIWCDSPTNLTSGLHSGFALNRSGDEVFLYNTFGERVDAISFGSQIADASIGRLSSAWTLTTPTPGAANQGALLAPSSALAINEWLANAAPGGEDWIELHNTSAVAPVSLHRLYLATSNALDQLRDLSFIPARGWLQISADENPGPGHLNFRLPASSGSILLRDVNGAELQRITYGSQLQAVSQGRLPDGSTNLVAFPGSASPGASNYVLNYTGPILNELLARNASAVVSPWGTFPDYLELYNPSGSPSDIGGMGLGDSPDHVDFLFAPGTSIPPGGFLTVWCDESLPPSVTGNLNTGFSLPGNSGGVYLYNSVGQVVNSVEFGFQVVGRPIGLNGGQWRLLESPTPGATNSAPMLLGSTATLRFNEWMAAPAVGDDWFELYNPASQPVSLAGLILTDDPSLAGISNTPVAALSFINAGGWVKWVADGHPSAGRDHANFSLEKSGETLRLLNPDASVIDSVSFGLQAEGVSEGLLPDGGTNLVRFPVSATPDESNYLPLPTLVINEVLAHTDPPLEDAIEIWNTGGSSTNLAGWYVSNSSRNLKKHRIAAGTILAPGAFKVLYETNFNAGGNGTNFTLNAARGDSVFLSQADAAGNLTGYRAQVSFGGTENGVSLGRFPTSLGVDFTAMNRRTFGADNPATVAQFRTGSGLSNSYPLVGPIVINEIMYHPSSGLGTNVVELADEEFIELYNRSASAVPLYDPANPSNTWQLDGGVRFRFATGTSLPANGYLLIVNFDPATNVAAVAAFRAKYGPGGTLVGPMDGRLANDGEALELYKPDAPQQAPHPDAGYVPMILADRVAYGDVAPWPLSADGGGASLQRLAADLYGNEPLNWKSEAPNAGATNVAAALAAPTILAQPSNLVVLANQSVSFTVRVSGTAPLSFQWQRNNTNLVGEVADTLNIAAAQLSDAGTYRVVVTNLAGGITSQGAVLTVLAPPTVLVPPSSQTVIAGSNALFSVTASGTGPLSYQWRFNGLALENQTAPQLVLTSVQPNQSGDYTVVITNVAGSVTSAVATLNILVPPVITSEPASAAAVAGDNVTFTVAATGTAPLYFQWRKDGINLPGANGFTLAIGNVDQADEGAYSVIVTNAAGIALSQEAVLTVAVDVILGIPRQIPGGGFEFLLQGATNRSYAIEFSSNLTGWTNLTNITLTSPQRLFQDGGASNAPTRFYRVRQN